MRQPTTRTLYTAKSVHEGYEDLIPSLELKFAQALEDTGLPWFRNPPRTGYGIPLVSIEDTANFYPDFIVWTATSVICIDTKAPHILQGEAVRKLLSVAPRRDGSAVLEIRFVTPGEFTSLFEKLNNDGCTLWGLKSNGTMRAQHFETFEWAVEYLVGATIPEASH